MEAISSVKEGGDLAGIGSYLQAILGHTAAHIDTLALDPTRKDLLDGLKEQFQSVGKVMAEISGDVAKQQAEAQAQQADEAEAMQEMQMLQGGGDPKEQLAQMRVERDEARRDMKTQNDMERKDAKNAQQMTLNR